MSNSVGMVRLERGSHRSANDGVCVVELASMIGGEPFSDRPRCVCRVVGAFLRSWNDRAGYADRQRLYPYASQVVGTGGYRRISRIRRDICLSHAGANLDRGLLWRIAARMRMRGRIAWSVGLWPAVRLESGAGSYAARVSFARGGSEEAFALLDRLLGVDSAPSPQSSNGNGNGNGNGRPAAELAIRATIAAREPARSRAARESGSLSGAAEGRRRDRRARRPSARS